MGTSVVEFKHNLTTMMDNGDLSLPSTVNPDAFRNAAIIAVQTNPDLRKLDPTHIFTAVRHLAGMGLVPDNREAAIVPFKGRAQAMPMVYGIIKSLKQSGQVMSIFAEVVYEGEVIEVWIEDGERKFDHRMADGSKINPMDRGGGKIEGAFAVAKLRDGTVEFEPMSKQEIEKRRKASANQKDAAPTGIWRDWYEEMAKKTVIRAIAKRLPMSAEDRTVIDKDPTFIDPDLARDITPRETTEERLARLAQQRIEDEDQSPPVKPEDEAQSAVLDVEDEDQSPEYDATLWAPMDAEFTAGVKAFEAGMKETMCPHTENPAYSQWLGGFREALKAADKTG